MVEDRRKEDRRKTFSRDEDQAQQHSQEERCRKFHSLLELGRLIGLDLELNDMLLQISQKTCEVMEPDRCSLFLLGAGGKGLDLLRIKTYGQRLGFDISVASQRCIHIPTERDLCPGNISECPQCRVREDCFNTNGSTFCVSFSVTRGEML